MDLDCRSEITVLDWVSSKCVREIKVQLDIDVGTRENTLKCILGDITCLGGYSLGRRSRIKQILPKSSPHYNHCSCRKRNVRNRWDLFGASISTGIVFMLLITAVLFIKWKRTERINLQVQPFVIHESERLGEPFS